MMGIGKAAAEGDEVIVEKEVVEVEREVVVEECKEVIVQTGLTDADMAAIEGKIEQERIEFEQQALAERKALEEQKELAEDEKRKLLEDIATRQKEKEDAAAEQASMLQKVKAMEEKMLVGSQVLEKAMLQEQDLRKAAIEVEDRKREEARIKEELEQQHEEKLYLEEKYVSAEEQVQKMTAKLEKLWNRKKQTEQEIQDLQQEFQLEREDMLETIRELHKQVKLVSLTIDQFIPMEHYQQIYERAHWDESSDEWIIQRLEFAGNRIRPQSKVPDDSREGKGTAHGKLLRGTNSDRTPPREDLLRVDRPNVYYMYTEDGGAQRCEVREGTKSPSKTRGTGRMKSAGRPGTASRKGRAVKSSAGHTASDMALGASLAFSQEPDIEEVTPFPRARGLVIR